MGDHTATTTNLPAVIDADVARRMRDNLNTQSRGVLQRLQRLLLDMDDERQYLALQGEAEALLEGLTFMRTLRTQLSVLERATEDDVAALLKDWPREGRARRWTIDGIGLVELANQYPPRKWDDAAVVRDLVRSALDPEGTGEVSADMTVTEAGFLVAAVLTNCARLDWRTGTTPGATGVATYGLDPNAYRDEAGEPRTTVKITPPKE